MTAKKRVLVVDDSPTAIMWETLILRTLPVEILTARDGEEGVEVAVSSRPDLILMDFVMPKMSGLEACRALRARDITREIPIIMVTTRHEDYNVEAGYASGCSDYITKPIDKLELLAKVQTFLGM